jgi:hypothetical protein
MLEIENILYLLQNDLHILGITKCNLKCFKASLEFLECDQNSHSLFVMDSLEMLAITHNYILDECA